MITEFTRNQVEMSFRKFVDYSNDVINSDYNSFNTFLGIFIHFCETDNVMNVISNQLKCIKIDDAKIIPNKFRLPYNELERTAFLYQFCLKLNESESGINILPINFFGSIDRPNDQIVHFTNKMFIPMHKLIGYKIDEIKENIDSSLDKEQKIPVDYFLVFQNNTFSNSNLQVGNTDKMSAKTTSGSYNTDNSIRSSISQGDHSTISGSVATGNNPTIVNTVTDNAVWDKEPPQDNSLFELAYFLIERFGEDKIKKAGILSFSVPVVSFFIGIFNITGHTIPLISEFFSKYFTDIIMPLLVVLFIAGIFLISLANYSIERTCENCGRKRAYEETNESCSREIKKSDGYKKTIYRTFKCKYCGNIKKYEYVEKKNKTIY